MREKTADLYLHLSLKGGEKPILFPLAGKFPVRIGSSLANDILVNSPETSPLHAEIVSGQDGFILRDPGKKTERPLVPGQALILGNLAISLESDPAPRARPTGEKSPGKSSPARLRLILFVLIGLALAFLFLYPAPSPRTAPSLREETGNEPENPPSSPVGGTLSLPPGERISRARASVALGEQRLRDRRISIENLSLARAEFRKAADLLEGLSPAPDLLPALESRLQEAENLLEEEFRGRKFSAEQAVRFQDLDRAELELKNIQKLIPEPDDSRHRYAQERLKEIGRAN